MITVTHGLFRAEVQFRYDPNLVGLLKDIIPSYARTWDGGRKIWTVDNIHLPSFLGEARRRGYEVREPQRAHQATPPPPRPNASRGTWADQLLAAVGPTRSDAVFKALTRVLHPDVATGDTVLMQELNRARTTVAKVV